MNENQFQKMSAYFNSILSPRALRFSTLVLIYAIIVITISALALYDAATKENDLSGSSLNNLTSQINTPSKISLPRLGINAIVQPGVYDPIKNIWNVSETTAHFMTISSPPNNTSGKTIIYAHNTRNLFGPTAKAQAGDKAIITTDTGEVFNYVYSGEVVVTPTDTEVLETSPTDSPQLVLLTCGGSWNQKRRLLYFNIDKGLL